MIFNKTSKKTVKFGGSSLADSKQFKKVAGIILSDKSRRYVVPSAPGKRFGGDDKVTDLLLAAYKASTDDGNFSLILLKIAERYESIIDDLGLEVSLEKDFAEIEARLKEGCGADYIASRGEYLNGKLLAAYIGYDFVDAAEVIFFDKDGNFDADKTNEVLAKRLSTVEHAVIPGFYGCGYYGEIKTFSRGGSDITGAIVARAVMADVYENWTDVSGFMMCDPRIVSNPKPISVITYRELRELAYMGATVLHEDSIFPVKLAGIPINIKNTNYPDEPGTMIVHSAEEYPSEDIVTGIAGKKGFSIIHIEKDMMNKELGFGMRVLKVFNDLGISFEHLPSGIDTMCVVVSDDSIKGIEGKILQGIQDAVSADNIDIERGLGLIAVVGRGMIKNRGTASRIFSALANAGINIRMIDQGSSELNIIIGVDEADFETAISTIYYDFEAPSKQK